MVNSCLHQGGGKLPPLCALGQVLLERLEMPYTEVCESSYRDEVHTVGALCNGLGSLISVAVREELEPIQISTIYQVDPSPTMIKDAVTIKVFRAYACGKTEHTYIDSDLYYVTVASESGCGCLRARLEYSASSPPSTEPGGVFFR